MRRHSSHRHSLSGNDRGFAPAVAVAAALAGAAAPAAAETAPAANSGLEEIVVTATRHEESLSKVPLSVTAITQEGLDLRGIKDIQDLAKFTPGVTVDNSGTNNISIRGIASTGGAGTTGIYVDETPIQMRALAFNPDDALPKSFDIDRVEVLRGPQGTLFGAGSEGGTVRYITTQPSLSKSSVYSRSEISFTRAGDPSYEAGIAAGGPLIDGKFGARITAWYRRDGGWIDRIDPVTLATVDKKVNHVATSLVRVAAIWAPSEKWTLTPSLYYQDQQRHDVGIYWPLYSNPGSNHFVSANPTQRAAPDTFYLPALKVEGDFGTFHLISNSSYYHRKNTDGYDGTLYNLGFYQAQTLAPVFPSSAFLPGTFPVLDATGVHLPATVSGYRSPASVDNGQQNFTEEVRLQSSEPDAKLVWTTGVFYSINRQSYLEQIHDPMLNALSIALTGNPYTTYFVDPAGNPVPYDPAYPNDSYFLKTDARDEQLAWFGEGTYAFTDTLKATVGARFSRTKYSFDTLTGGPQLFDQNRAGRGTKQENSVTPKLSLAYQPDTDDLLYATYAKGFRPGGANNPVPPIACAGDFALFGISQAPATFDSDSVQSYEIGAKNNLNNRVRVASSVYYIRWHNIQQTVIPPICQISFIANLGEAVAKGADLQAQILLTPSFTADVALGYTDARYTQDSRLNPAEQKPLVAKGDAVIGQSGQPGAPFTATVGLEYKFSAFDHESFVRVDYSHDGRAKWPSAPQDPQTLQADALNVALPATNFVSLRGGTTVGSWAGAAFVDNLTNAHTLTNYNNSIDPLTGDTRLKRAFTFRPRTIGLTFTYRL